MNKPALVEKYFLFILLAIVIVVTLMIFSPFMSVIVISGAFAVVLEPVYLWIKKRITRGISSLAAILTILLFLIVLCIPLFFVGTIIFNQAQDVYYSLADGNISTYALVDKIDISINKLMPNGFVFDTKARVTELSAFLSNNITNFFSATFNSIFAFILTIFAIFYLLKDGKQWKNSVVKLSPLSEDHSQEIFSKLKSAINRILKGSFLIAIIQGILAGIGFKIFGVPSPALWGVVAGIASFIPTLGTSLVSVPAMLYLLSIGLQLHALGLLLWSVFLIGLIDNFLSPYLISKNTEIPSLFILFSIIGGIALMGPVGGLIGPLVLSLLYSLVSIYKKETVN